jgi:hypothetical protein
LLTATLLIHVGSASFASENLLQEISERKTALMQIDGRLLANSMRLIAESRELLRRLDKPSTAVGHSIAAWSNLPL